MLDRDPVGRYFDENSESWVRGGYVGDGYVFPTALARARKTLTILAQQFPNGSPQVVDLGCGAGQLSLDLAEMGFKVVGVDESESMLQQGQQRLRAATPEVRSRVRFLNKDLRDNGLESGTWDAVTALGVIGYLPNDDVLFAEAARLLRPAGVFILSCRNRLFNMVSISEYTLREIEQGSAKQLVEEIRELLQRAPEGDVLNFLSSLASVSKQLVSELAQKSLQKEDPAPPTVTTSIEARQHTPKQVLDTAKSLGFKYEAFYGVHPHLLMAGLNRSLPPTTFNVLASSLETLHHLPISLIWSSVFLGVFRKIP